MSVEALNYVRRVKVGNSTAKFALTRLADRADERFSCFPSVELIAAEIEVTDRTVQRALALLRELRLISDRAAYRADGSQTTSRYYLHGPWDQFGGTGIPFPEIVEPKQARAQMWAAPPTEGEFREGTAAAVAVAGDQDEAVAAAERAAQARARTAAAKDAQSARGRKAATAKRIGGLSGQEEAGADVSAGEEGVTAMSPPPVTLMSPLESPVTTPTTDPTAPSARSAHGVRSTSSSGSDAREGSGSAASGKAGSSTGEGGKTGVPVQRSSASAKLTSQQMAAVRVVEAGLPDVLREQLPYKQFPKENRAAVLEALESRTPEQLAARAARRWVDRRYEVAFHDGKIKSHIGVALELLAPSRYCPDLSCDGDGTLVDSDERCKACEKRIEDRTAARLAGRPVPSGKPSKGLTSPECDVCQRPVPGAARDSAPEDIVCQRCLAELDRNFQDFTGSWAVEGADREAEVLAAEALEQEAQRRRALRAAASAPAVEDVDQAQAVATAEDDRRIQAEILAANPWMAQHATPETVAALQGPPPF